MKKVAVNGFGRIGRAFVRSVYERDDIEIVAINDLMDCETAAYMLQYDTVYGTFPEKVEAKEGKLMIGGKEIEFLSEKSPAALPWRSLDVDVVIEATGVFTSYEKASAHMLAGAKKIIISAPVKDAPPESIEADTVLHGVNTDRGKTCSIVSNASCTTNAVGIPMKVIDEEIGIQKAVLNTVHGYTSSQQIVDGVSKKNGNLRYGRSGSQNIVPSSTGAAIATTKVLDGLEGKFDGLALRVPVVAGSIVDITFIASRPTTVEEVNTLLKRSESRLFKTTTDPLVSSDIIGKPFVSIADLSLTRVVDKNLVKVLFWYDNEMGYTQSLVEQTLYI